MPNRLPITLAAYCLPKGDERYILVVEPEWRVEAIRTLGRWAANPDLSFDERDEAALAAEIYG